MKIAAACYPIDWIEGFDCYADKVARWVGEAAGAGADLLVFPEYGAMELAATAGRGVAGDLEASLVAVSDLMPRAWDLHADLAARHGVHILAASGPVFVGDRPVNRAMFFAPTGARQAHDKQIMTRWERDPMNAVPGAAPWVGAWATTHCPSSARAIAPIRTRLKPSSASVADGTSRISAPASTSLRASSGNSAS